MRTHTIHALAAALLLTACSGAGRDAEDAGEASTPAATSSGTEAARAAAISNAIAASPASTDSILAANGLTVIQLEAMMFRIARDSTASAEYARLTAR